MNGSAAAAGQREVQSEVRKRPGSPETKAVRGTAEAKEGRERLTPVPVSYQVSTPTQIINTPLRRAHQSTSLTDDLAKLGSLDSITAVKWLGAGAALSLVVI